MAQTAHGDARAEIDVILAVQIPQHRAFAVVEDHLARLVVGGVELFAFGNQLGRNGAERI